MIVTAEKTLKADNSYYEGLTKDLLISNYTDKTKKYSSDYKTVTESQSLFYVLDDLEQKEVYQPNYLHYLELCWAKHLGVVLTPDIIWYTLLCEITGIVLKDPEKYRHLFTRNPEGKERIIVLAGAVEILPLHLIIAKLEEKVPTDIDIFLPSFTTTTSKAKNAQYASFAEMVSPFYDYCTLLCGIPYYDIRGTEKDWIDLGVCWSKISKLFVDFDGYFNKVSKILSQIVLSFKESNNEFWKEMFYVKRCGSGSDTDCHGWFTDLFLEQPEYNVRKASNFSAHVSSVPYKNLDTNREFVLKQGLFVSEKQNEFLVPEFGQIVYEKKEQEVQETDKKEHELKIESCEVKLKPRQSDIDWKYEVDPDLKSTKSIGEGYYFSPYIPTTKTPTDMDEKDNQ